MKADIDSGKSLITEESFKIFEEKADSIRRDLNYIILSYGFGIVLSFLAIFLTTSVIAKQIPNYWIWFLLVGVITSVVSTSYWFNHIWQSLQHFSDFLFKKSIEQQLSGLGDNL
jgi:hypothetical protein